MECENTGIVGSVTSGPKDIWHVIRIDNGSRIKKIEMHVDGLEDCFYCRTLVR
jgi:hypothetical protein